MVPITEITGRLGNQMFQFAYIYSQFLEGVIPDVYLQDHKYFEKHESEIKKLFSSQKPEIPYVSIHIRRGDYVGNQFYVDLTQTDYYKKAIALFPEDTFMVFSDDVEFAREYLAPLSDKFVFYHSSEIDDLNLMSRCKHNIIANSSFSWWGAFLNQNQNKKVVFPKDWYSDGVNRTQCPKSWIPI